MNHYKTSTKNTLLTVKVKLGAGVTADTAALGQFSTVSLRELMKPQKIKKGSVIYSGPIGVPVSERLTKPISKHDFLFIIEQIVNLVREMNRAKLSPDKVVWDINHSFINEITKEIRFLYLPMEPVQQAPGILDYLEAVIYTAKPESDSSSDFVSNFVFFIKRLSSFDADRIEEYIWQEDRSVVERVNRERFDSKRDEKRSAKGSDTNDDTPTTFFEGGASNRNKRIDEDDGDMPTGYLSEEEMKKTTHDGTYDDDVPTGFLSENADGNPVQNEDIDGDTPTGFFSEDGNTSGGTEDDYDGDSPTGYFTVEENETGKSMGGYTSCAVLIRCKTRESIYINKPVFRIGRERSAVDCCIKDNPKVGRSHADVVTRGNRYFVTDLNSLNHTFINSEQLPVKTECEIVSGDRLTLADEEFIFKV